MFGQQSSGSMDFLYIVFLAIILLPMLRPVLRRLFLKFHPHAIAVLSIDGVIKYGGDDRNPFTLWLSALKEIFSSKPKAIVVRINSPGGTVGASQELYEQLVRIRKNGTKVVACLEDVAASGGYYIALAADRIVAQPGTITGSIGVIMQTYELVAILERFQIKVRTIKSGAHKDILSPAREMTEEEQVLLQDMVMNVYGQFIHTAAKSRNLSLDYVRQFADGRIFSGEQALKCGFVDECGSSVSAIRVAAELSGIDPEKALPILYKPRRGLFGGGNIRSFFKRAESMLPDADLRSIPLWLMPRN